jgi:hypothetical protein
LNAPLSEFGGLPKIEGMRLELNGLSHCRRSTWFVKNIWDDESRRRDDRASVF